MTRRVYLHVGLPKSGTTYLQTILRANRAPLAEHGYAVAGKAHVDLVHAGMVVREDPRLERLPERAGRAWQRLLDEIEAWSGDAAIVSYELFAGATAEQAARAVADLAAYEVHVVITARDLGRALPSAWQERLKFALTTPLEEWQPPPETDERSEWGWRTLDPAGVAERLGRVGSRRARAPRDHAARRPARPALAAVRRGVRSRRTSTWSCRSGSRTPRSAPPRRRCCAGSTRSPGRPSPTAGNRPCGCGTRSRTRSSPASTTSRWASPTPSSPRPWSAASRAARRLAASAYTWHGDPDDLTPTRREARTPGQVDDERLLRVSVDAIWQLLLALREERRRKPVPEVPVRGPRSLLRAAEHGVLLVENQRLHRRLDELEDQLRQSRRLQHRIAAVTDVVGELLLPAADQDEERLAEAVDLYRQENL